MTDDPRVISGANLTYEELAELYQYPLMDPDRTWIRVNFIASVDGATTTNGTSEGLTSPLDKRVLQLLRDLSDVVLVGASTIRKEDYIGIRVGAGVRADRLAQGMSEVPPIAVVTAQADIDPRSRLLTHTEVPPIILTTTTAPAASKHGLERAGAQVIELGAGMISTASLLDALAGLGLRRVICEGGPTLTGQLVADSALNELCITTSPIMLGGNAPRVAQSQQPSPLEMQCKHIIFDTDGSQLARWTAIGKPVQARAKQ